MTTAKYFGKETGKLGFGNMRLPKVDGKNDYVTIHKMIDTFLEAGYNYFDTCYVYDASEKALGEALVKRYPRESFQINTKLTLLKIKSADEMQERFEESLRRLQTDYVDFYFLHAMHGPYLKKADEIGAWDFLKSLKEKGLAKHIGFSFHDSPELLDDTLTKHPETELCLVQLNYLDWENPKMQSRSLYETCRKHNVPISIMEPCKGGWLASETSDSGKYLKSINPDVSVASWAFRYLADLEGVHSILTGMGKLSEVEDNLKTFERLKPLTAEEHMHVRKAVEIINSTPGSNCTECKYCLPYCPQGIVIPGCLGVYNDYLIHRDLESMQHLFYMMGLTGKTPKDCIMCKACEPSCPQQIEIADYMAKINGLVR